MKPCILLTKLHAPQLRSKLIIRESLIEKISDGINNGSKLILVSAPAGYGKSTIVLEWISSNENTCSWVSLDDGDNDIVCFLSYIIEALKNAKVLIGKDTERLLFETQLASDKVLLTMLLNDISLSAATVTLILDDYHNITSENVHEAARFLIEHQPSNLHIVITTREDPPLMLSKLRVRGEITEIRVEDLCFDKLEADKFFSEVMGISLKKEVVETIANRTEGWVAGLQLAGLSLRSTNEDDIDYFINEFTGAHHYVIDYLIEEILSHQSNEISDFLRKTSILDRMNPELCNAVTGRLDSREILYELERANLFIIPLDDKREWYRYHQLFADSLRIELSKEEERLIHVKAAAWLKNNGFKQEAVKHGFKSGDLQFTLGLIEENVEGMFKNAQLTTLLKWIDLLPEYMILGSEALSVRKGWVLYITGNIKRAIEYAYSFSEAYMMQISPHNKGLLLSLQALLSLYTGIGNIEELAAEALKLLEPWDPVARIATLNTLGGAQADLGRTNEANETYRNAYFEGLKLGYTFITTLALLYYGLNLNSLGRKQEAICLYEGYIEGMKASFGRPLPLAGLIYVSLAGLYYEENELLKAQDYALKGIEQCRSMTINWTLNSEAWLAKIQYAKGERAQALYTMQAAYGDTAEEKSSRKLLKNTETMVELLLREGKLDQAIQIAENWKTWLDSDITPLYEQSWLVYAKLLIAQDKLSEAIEIIKKVEQLLIDGQRLRPLITVYILYSRIYFKSNDKQKAYRYMENALKLAEKGQYIRAFLDEEEKLVILLGEMEPNLDDFGKRLLSLMSVETEKKAAMDKENRLCNNKVLVEQLSDRELELLKLIADGLTNGEIADSLFISINTTQWHISNIYSKLGVKNRTQAILKARELNLL